MTDLAGKTVIITGATGFIGRYVADELLDAGALVCAVVRPDSPHMADLPHRPGLNILSCDLEHIPQAYRNFAKETSSFCETSKASSGFEETDASSGFEITDPPYAFLHFAWGGVNRGEIDSDEVQQKNIDLSLACLDAAIELGCGIFMDAGSRVEYGIKDDGVMEEHLPCDPVNAYGRAKLRFFELASAIAKEHGLTCYHLRFFSVYGVGDHPWSVISTLTRDLPQGKTVSLSACLHRWNFMHVRDAASAVVELLRHADDFEGETEIVNIASSDTRVLKEFVEEIYGLCTVKCGSERVGTLEYGTFEQAKEGALSICPVTEELKRLTEGDWEEKVSFAQGITELIDKFS